MCIAFIAWQCFLPYSHGISKGYNNWTNGLYGYSWDMMIHSWNAQHIRVTYRDKDTGLSGYLDPLVWSNGNNRWSSHADMIKQYAHCIAANLQEYNIKNVEIYFDIWRSLNRRFQQRMIDPRVDLLTAEWSPFESTPWLLPLMTELSDWRSKLADIKSQLDSSAYTGPVPDVVFVADFPGLYLENYVHPDFGNTSLTVLAGHVILELPDLVQNFSLGPGDVMQIPSDTFHNVHTVSATPSSYMYMYVNTTETKLLEGFANFEADINTAQSVNKTLHKYRSDPNLPHYQQLLKAKQEDQNLARVSLWQHLKKFLWSKYNLLKRSLRLSQGAVYCLVTNSSFTDYLNATYHLENSNIRNEAAAAAASQVNV